MRKTALVLTSAALAWAGQLTGVAPAQIGPQTLDVTPESVTRAHGAEHTLTATVRQGLQTVEGANVDFEIESGPNDDDGGLTIPVDMTCTTGEDGTCTVSYTDDPADNPAPPDNVDTIRAWIDADGVDATIEADLAEGRNETTSPGAKQEPDDTDVVEVHWEDPQPGEPVLDAEPETGLNRPNDAHVLTATVTDVDGPVAGAKVAFQKTSGPGTLSATSCTTAADGTCQVTLTGDGSEGTATVRSWLDANDDDQPDEADLAEGRDEANSPGLQPEPDNTDVVQKTFQEERLILDVEPEQAINRPGTHDLDATVTNNFGEPEANQRVEFVVRSGPNQGQAMDCDTDAQGQCSVSYTSPPENRGTDTIFAWVDENGNGFSDEADNTEGRDEEQDPGAVDEPDNTDVVEKVWESIDLDVEPETGENDPETEHTLNAELKNLAGAPIEGEQISFEVESGPNRDLNGNPNTADRTCLTDAEGKCSVSYEGVDDTGTDTIRAWVDIDKDNAVPGEADTAEGPDEDAVPGDAEEPDGTDVVQKDWGRECPGQGGVQGNHQVGTPGDDRIEGTAGRDVQCGLGGDDELIGAGGNDIQLGGHGNDRLEGGAGDDQQDGDAGDDNLIGGPGDDSQFGGTGDDTAHGGVGNEFQRGGGGVDTLNGGAGDDTQRGGPLADTLRGGTGPDDQGGQIGDDLLRGGAEDDLVRGWGGDDELFGGPQNDRLVGGPGNDFCNGNAGNDQLTGCEQTA